jgi:hypothetical protein
MNERPADKGGSRKSLYAVITVLSIAVVGLLLLVVFGNILYPSQKVTLPPRVEIGCLDVGAAYEDPRIVVMTVCVRNTGGSATIAVWAEVYVGSDHWRKSRLLFLEPDVWENVTFLFQEIVPWTPDKCSYRVWVEY